ncbi:tyrosine-protein phosphatase non-receptor type 23 isoform X2 [Agrilus planipennis]|nr:tyrosine-protein phosphatase non-receptor type 23 isoform X2 [Agrilus planipennis]
MGERVAFYQKASEQLQDARKKCSNLQHQQEINEALAFTNDVIEGKCKAAKNENEFIYHEEVPDKDTLQDVKGASLVKGIPFNINDVEVSGQDIFSRLVPMETHEASSMYSEQKAQFLRQLGSTVESKDRSLAEFMSSLQIDVLTQMHKANGIPQQIIDRAAAMSAKPSAIRDLIDAMGKLSNSYQEVESMLKEIDGLLKEEEQKEQEYQSRMGARPPSIITTDLKREAAKYQEAHSKASESNQNLHKAMMSHIANLKVLSQPLNQLQQQIPSITLPNGEIDEDSLKEMEILLAKVDEMKQQRVSLWNQLRDAIQNDDITSVLITKSADQPLDVIFQNELEKHKKQATILEQNMSAQDNICKALVDAYARFTKTRRYINDIINMRTTTISALINSYDTYDDLLSKATKGIEFYGKLETNVTKLLQRIRSTCKVQDEEREQMLAKVGKRLPEPAEIKKENPSSTAPKLKDYLNLMKSNNENVGLAGTTTGTVAVNQSVTDNQMWPPSIRPAPVGSEMDKDQQVKYDGDTTSSDSDIDSSLAERMASLKTSISSQRQAIYNNYNSAAVSSQYPMGMTSVQYSQPPYASQGYQVPQQYTNTSVNYSYQYPSNNYIQVPQQYSQAPADHTTTPYSSTHTYQSYQQPTSTFSQIPQPSVKNPVVSTNIPSFPPTPLPSTSQYQAPDSEHQYYPPYLATSLYQPQEGYSYGTASSEQIADTSTQYYYQQQYQDISVSYPATQSQYVPIPDSSKAIGSTAVTNTTYTTLPNAVASPATQENASNLSYNYGTNSYSYTTPNSVYLTNTSTEYTPTESGLGSANNTSTYNAYEANPYTASTVNQYGTYTPHSYPISTDNYQAPSTSSNVYSNPANFQDLSSVQSHQYYYQGNTTADSTNYTYPYSQTNYTGQNVPYPNNSSQSYLGVTNSSYQNLPPNPSIVSPTYSVANGTQNTSIVSSNIDLLSGLDFSVSHPPLQPQKPEENEKAAETNKNVDRNLKESLTAKSEEKIRTVKSENPPLLMKLFEKIHKRGLFENLQSDSKVFLQELEKFEKFVEVLCNKTLSGPTTLDMKWKEIQDKQDLDQQKHIISVGRCYPSKNRFLDILPYDHTRVLLTSTKDDYINASILKNITPHCPIYLVTQTALQTTINDFWTMVWEQKVDFIVCLLNDQEIGKDIYWPKEKGQQLTFGNWIVTLQSNDIKEFWTQRIISLHRLEERDSRNLIHMQFTAWPGSLFPPFHVFSNFVKESINCWKEQQRTTSQPILVHCLSGNGRSGLFCLLTTAIIEFLNKPTNIPDLLAIASGITTARKNILRDREHLKFAFQVFLHYLQDIQLTNLGVKSAPETENFGKEKPLEKPTDNTDPLSTLDPLWATKRSK